jgi:hypothetical protein
MAPSLSLSSVVAILVLAPDAPNADTRLFAKYYTPPHHAPNTSASTPAYGTLKEQKAFEKGLLDKTAKQTSDVILYDNKVVVFKSESDVMLYVVGEAHENEVLLYNVVLCLRDSLSLLLKYVLLSCLSSNIIPFTPLSGVYSLTRSTETAQTVAPCSRITTSSPLRSTRSWTMALSSKLTPSWSPAGSAGRLRRTRPT